MSEICNLPSEDYQPLVWYENYECLVQIWQMQANSKTSLTEKDFYNIAEVIQPT